MAAVSSSAANEDWTNSMAGNARYSLPPGYNGSNGGGPRNGGASYQLPHVDDLVSVPKDIDSRQSIKRLLEMAEASLHTAEMGRDYGKPAQALKDFIRASIIAIQIISNHRDFPQLKDTRMDLKVAHNNLLKKISQQNDSFSKIKVDIIADNKKTGVKATARPQGDGSPRGQAGAPPPQTNGSPGKPKPPAVQPKPQSLHGNAIKPGHGRAASMGPSQPDLLSRFANLRGPQPSPGQDSRIKTHQIVVPKPAGPREMPPLPKPRLGLDSSISTLPKMPDAVYSPARGNLPGEAARLAASTPRGFTRTGSSASIAGTPGISQQPQSNDYFSPAQSHSGAGAPNGGPDSTVTVPQGDVITPEELYQAMKGKGSILLIDVRDREEYDDGHIMSSSSICIEPNVLMREGLSADQIAESLVISPAHEHDLFEDREQFDLVVFYDQDTEAIPRSAASSDDLALQSLHRALVEFNYGHELKNSAKILRGGLDAWVDLMGAGSLQSATMASARLSQTRRAGDISRRRRSKYMPARLKPDEVKVWQETLENDDMQTASSPTFVRSREDFLRRFPSVSEASESMTAPVGAGQSPGYGSSHKMDLTSDLPSPPTRPAPALPRPSYSSLSHMAASSEYDEPPVPPKPVGRTKTMEMAPLDTTKYYTGLNNPKNWCYANSTLQSLLASPEFGRELASSGWTERFKVPRKANEKIEQPQLMTRIITNLFHWMSTGKFKVMKAQTLMDYSRHICSKRPIAELFGDQSQHDAQEFMSFLLANLHEETNTRRDMTGEPQQPDTRSQPLVQASAEFWRNHRRMNDSLVDHYWRGIDLSTVECLECRTRTYRFAPFEWLPVTVVEGPATSLDDVLAKHFAPNFLDDFACDHCNRKTRAMQSLSLARMPSLLCVALRRFNFLDYKLTKSCAAVSWDLNDFDFSPYFLTPEDRARARAVDDKALAAPFRYECYAIVNHRGASPDSGHYYSWVRDPRTQDPYAWLRCNDEQVQRVRIGSGTPDDVQNQVFRQGPDAVPYVLFFRRKDVH